MKTLKLIIAAVLLLAAIAGQAQISVNLNVGEPPQWGPAGYSDVRYYFIPDVQAYYDVPSSKFIYNNGTTWIHSSKLPLKYRNYDLYSGYKVVLTDYRGNSPYAHFKEHKIKYAKGYKGQPQKSIGVHPSNGKAKAKIVSNGNAGKKVGKPNNNGNAGNKAKSQKTGNGKKK